MNWRPVAFCSVLAVPCFAMAAALNGRNPETTIPTIAPAVFAVEAPIPLEEPPAAKVTAPPVRLMNQQQVTETVPPPPLTIEQRVNMLRYVHYDPKPAMEAYRLVAGERGWSTEAIEAWSDFAFDVMFGESAFCWNRRRGDEIVPYSACVHVVRDGVPQTGRHEDVGFGQATASLYGQGAQLCTIYGICSRAQILASPYASMKWSLVVPMELNGRQPWCYDAAARRYHPTCNTISPGARPI